MSDNSKRPHKRVSEDRSVKEIGEKRKKVKVGTIRTLEDAKSKHTRQKDVPVFLINNEVAIIPTGVSDKVDESLSSEDKRIIAIYLNTSANNIQANQIISADYLVTINLELQEYPFWIYIDTDEQSEIRDLYLEYYYQTLLLQSYSHISESVPDDEEEIITRFVDKRAEIIDGREKISNQIGTRVNGHLEKLPNDTELIVVPVEFEDEIDYSSSLHQTILLNATNECRVKSRRVI